MAKYLVLVGLPLAVIVGSLSAVTSGSDKEAIRQTALDYGEGWYEGDAERMERALHPDLAKRALMPDPGTGKGKIDHMTASMLVQATQKGLGTKVSPEERRTDVTILDVYGNAASVKLQMHDWVDYLHMVKTEGQWKIVNVLWEFTPEAKKKYGIPAEL
jgi:hypothetical protein